MSNETFHRLLRELGMHQRRKTVEHLLSGNDTQCFTTEQYIEAYVRLNWNPYKNAEEVEKSGRILRRYVRDHLLSVSDMVQEVKPDVWASIPSDVFLEEVF